MKVLLPVLLMVAAVFADDTCPNFRDWMPWTDHCTWFPLTRIRDDIIAACDVKVTGLENAPTMPPMPAGFPSEGCGHCSYKFRCRKREKNENCSPFDGEIDHCHDGAAGDICSMPKLDHIPQFKLGCKYALVPYMIGQCAARPDQPEWRREMMNKWISLLPKFHCHEDGDDCKCCCHPYVPSADGSTCEMKEEPQCEEYSEWNNWSEKCLFFPPGEMRKDFEEHCDFSFGEHASKNPLLDKLKLPDGMEPSRCGYCSFQVKCRQRSAQSAAGKKECFPLDVQKKACGNEQCEGCGDICELPKLGDCDYNAKLIKLVQPAIKSRMKKMPASMRHNLLKMLSGMPHGKCVEKDGKCMCCCHPYKPNEDGTACVLNEICKNPEEIGMEVDMNLSDDAFWMF